MNYTEDYRILMDLMIDLVESQAGISIDPSEAWVNDAQILSIKLFRHLVSMQTIALGATIEQHSVPAYMCIDHASVKVIARAALETYLVFFYIYGNGINSTAEYRYRAWKLAGLSDRQKIHTSIKEHKVTLEEEKKQMEDLKLVISQSEDFIQLSEKQKKSILNGEWKVGKAWSELGKSAGFHEKYFKNVYGYLCGYSHSSYISVLQVGQAKTIEDQQMLTEFIMGVGVVIMAHFSHSYSSLFETATIVFSKELAAKKVADKWRFGSEEMAVVYDR